MTTRETRSAVGGVPGSPSDAWVVKGTRAPLWSLFANLTGGGTIREYMQWFPGVGNVR